MLKSAREMAGIVLLRFRPVPRIWAALLVLVNVSSLFFLDTRYGQVAFAAIALGALAMVVIHARLGFVRLLGVGHVLWIPMLIWFAMELPKLEEGTALRSWMSLLIAFNSVSLVVDCIDVVRYARGEREPHYSWS